MSIYSKSALYLLFSIGSFSQTVLSMSNAQTTITENPLFDLRDNQRDFFSLFGHHSSPTAIRDYSPSQAPSEWGNVRLIHESIAHTYGIDLSSTYIGGPCLLSFERSDKSSQISDMLPHEVSSQTVNEPGQTAEQALYDATTNLTQSIQEMSKDTHDSCKIESTQQSSNQSIEAASSQFSDLTAYDSNHAVEPLSNKEVLSYINSYGYQPRLECPEAIQRLELLMSPSSDPTALATQIEVSMGNDKMYQCYFRPEIGQQYRSFLWDTNGQFKPINTQARQEKALEILYPVIKSYFGRNHQELIAFLKQHSAQGTPGFERLLNLETGRASFGEHANNVGNSISKSFSSLNVFHKVPTTGAIANSAFVQGLSKMVAQIKTGQFKKAKEVIECFKVKISKTDIDTRSQVIEEYNCLCAQYTALTAKMLDKYKSDPHYQICDRLLQGRTMSLAEAFKILDGRHHAANSLAFRMGLDLKTLSTHDKNLIYKEIDSKTKDSWGLQDLYEHKDLLTDKDLTKLKEKLECFEIKQKIENSPSKAAQLNNENTAIAPHGETEPIERPVEVIQQESSITASPPPLEPKEPKEKEDEKQDFENTLNKNKEYSDSSKQLNKLKEKTPDTKIKDHWEENINIETIEKLDLRAKNLYENIRNNKTDILDTAKNLNLKQGIVEKVKNHVFYNKHNLHNGRQRLSPDLNIAETWQRIVDNKFSRTDIEWFLHEFCESILTEAHPEAQHSLLHEFASQIHNWSELLI